MKKNLLYVAMTIMGSLALVLGSTSCKKEEPAMAVGSKWQITEQYRLYYENGIEDVEARDTVDLTHEAAQYWYFLSTTQVAFVEGMYGEYANYLYDEKCKLLKVTYEFNGRESTGVFEVLEKTDNTLKLREHTYHSDDYRYNYDTEEYEDFTVDRFQLTTLVKQ